MKQADSGELPDLTVGVADERIPTDAVLPGRVGDRTVLLARSGGDIVAVQAECPHYGAPLADGCLSGGALHCPWHHAAFDLRDGAVERPPALAPLRRWAVERCDGIVRVADPEPLPLCRPPATGPGRDARVVVLGAGAAGTAAVLTLRERGHEGPLTWVDPDPDAPYDRPNLSKDYLTGAAPEEWLPLRGPVEWGELGVRRVVGSARTLDLAVRRVVLDDGNTIPWDALLLATGAEPRPVPVPGADLPHVRTLRTLADCRALRRELADGGPTVVVGAGFLGLEVAASLRTLGLPVHVVGPERQPLDWVVGRALGDEIRRMHESRGVTFHLGAAVEEILPDRVRLSNGAEIPAARVVACVGVRPRVQLARDAGLDVDDGVRVDLRMRTEIQGVYAAGDLARFPHPGTRRPLRIEHWAVAEAQGRVVALNILGEAASFDDVPFFWAQHFDVTLAWTGYPDPWDEVVRSGSLEEGSASYRFQAGGQDVALLTVGRDRESLRWETEHKAVLTARHRA